MPSIKVLVDDFSGSTAESAACDGLSFSSTGLKVVEGVVVPGVKVVNDSFELVNDPSIGVALGSKSVKVIESNLAGFRADPLSSGNACAAESAVEVVSRSGWAEGCRSSFSTLSPEDESSESDCEVGVPINLVLESSF